MRDIVDIILFICLIGGPCLILINSFEISINAGLIATGALTTIVAAAYFKIRLSKN
jgi:shikimate kinase